MASQLHHYDVVVPRKVTAQGATIGHDLSHDYSVSELLLLRRRRQRQRPAELPSAKKRQRRSLDAADDRHHLDVHYRFNISGQERHFHLQPNENLLAPAFVIERVHGRNGRNATTAVAAAEAAAAAEAIGQKRRPSSIQHRRLHSATDRQCHYIGQVRTNDSSPPSLPAPLTLASSRIINNVTITLCIYIGQVAGHSDSQVGISACSGLVSFISLAIFSFFFIFYFFLRLSIFIVCFFSPTLCPFFSC